MASNVATTFNTETTSTTSAITTSKSNIEESIHSNLPPVVACTKNLSCVRTTSTSSSSSDVNPDQRDDAKKNMFKAMRPLPIQHYWIVYFQSQQSESTPQLLAGDDSYKPGLKQIGSHIGTVQEFWRYNNNMPIEKIKMRGSIFLFKQGFQPIWEDRRNLHGGSWTFRVPKVNGPDFWTRIQLMAIGEKLQGCLESGDQLCGVGLSVRFNSHLISIWHRDSSKQNSIDGMLKLVLEELPPTLYPKTENYFYKKHSDHASFKVVRSEKTIKSLPEISAQV